jgi:polysaccharide biosynthesis/export protein
MHAELTKIVGRCALFDLRGMAKDMVHRRSLTPAVVFRCFVMIVLASLISAVGANAQSGSGPTASSILNQIQSSGQTPQGILQSIANGSASPQSVLNSLTGGSGSTGGLMSPQTTIPQTTITTLGTPNQGVPRARSDIELKYSTRANIQLTQFGYDIIGNVGTVGTLQIGALADDYILGQGDEIIVTLRGQDYSTLDTQVDRDGNVTLPKVRPIPAAGRRLGDFRRDLLAAIKSTYLQTQAFVTLGNVRQLSVSVEGEVVNPGTYAATGLSRIVDVLQQTGGIKKSGSLRRIFLVRGREVFHLDLYGLLIAHGKSANVTVAQGDRIVVPPIGATIAIGGEVGRPGIYELPQESRSTDVRAALTYANGFVIPGSYYIQAIRNRPDGRRELVDVTKAQGTALRDGEILLVTSAMDRTLGKISLRGAIRIPGLFALNQAKTLHDLLPSADSFLPDAYMLLGFIQRIDQNTAQRQIVPFSPLKVLEGKENLQLQSDDIVHVLTVTSMSALIAQELPINLQSLQSQQTLQNQQNLQNQNLLPGGNNQYPTLGQNGMGSSGLSSICNAAQQNNSAQPWQGQSTQSSTGQLAQLLQGQSANQGQGSNSALCNTIGPILAGQSANGGGAANGSQPNSPNAFPGGLSGNMQSDLQGNTGQSGNSPNGGSGQNGNGETLSDSEAADYSEILSNTEYALILADYRISLEGDVREPGNYLVAPGTTLDDLVAAAKGLRPDVNLQGFEITSTIFDNARGASHTKRTEYSLPPERFSEVELQPLDAVRFNQVFQDRERDANVYLGGQVRYPGRYSILRGETLSSVIARAGGLTEQAYPYGAVFTRTSVATQQTLGFKREAKDIQEQLILLAARGSATSSTTANASAGIDAGAAAFLESVVNQIGNTPATGRIQVIADPAVLAVNKQDDVTLVDGDVLVVPPRPSEVTVVGEVQYPGSYLAKSDLAASDYIDLAGGYGRYADESYTFIIYPDGTSRQIDSSFLFDFSPSTLPPGSVILVPKDLKPLDAEQLTVDVIKALSDVALTAASAAVLIKN